MEITGVPIIIVCCYVIGEIYKLIFKRQKDAYKLIPFVLSIVGGGLGILIFITSPKMIFNTSNIWKALGIGMMSGASSTGANQIIKQLFARDKLKDE